MTAEESGATAPRRHVALVHARHARTGGAERYLNDLAAHLAEQGHRVTIVCRRHEEAPHPRVAFARLRVAPLGNLWRTWAFARAVERHVASADYDVVVGLGRTWSQHVVRCGGCHPTFAEIERRHVLRPWERWIGKGRLKARQALAIERRAFAPGRYRRIIANSELVRRDLMRRHGLPEQDIDVVYNGVDLARFHPGLRSGAGAALRRELGFGPGDFVAIFLGGGFARKGLGPLLEALAVAVRHRPELRLLVVGSDRRAADYHRRARSLGLGEHVRFVGRRSDPEICLVASDLHVLPTWFDSFGYSVLEALATGLPVVTTANAGAAELVKEGIHGTILPSVFTPRDIAGALVAWSEPGRAAAAAPAARAVAEAHPRERCASESARVILEVADRLERERAAGRPPAARSR